ncbi:hypothetical protein BKA62DRAFT_691860 [Auriculariales sp. MPI-PUGE-AT-0066]|nr:hypothetical protein BKA62DRAFT_691860 [Auriculariales sp. MPI-PUGE-AT-0066]
MADTEQPVAPVDVVPSKIADEQDPLTSKVPADGIPPEIAKLLAEQGEDDEDDEDDDDFKVEEDAEEDEDSDDDDGEEEDEHGSAGEAEEGLTAQLLGPPGTEPGAGAGVNEADDDRTYEDAPPKKKRKLEDGSAADADAEAVTTVSDEQSKENGDADKVES